MSASNRMMRILGLLPPVPARNNLRSQDKLADARRAYDFDSHDCAPDVLRGNPGRGASHSATSSSLTVGDPLAEKIT